MECFDATQAVRLLYNRQATSNKRQDFSCVTTATIQILVLWMSKAQQEYQKFCIIFYLVNFLFLFNFLSF